MARSGKSAGRYRTALRDAISDLLPRNVPGLLPKDGKTRWTSTLLVLCAILMTWSSGTTLEDRFQAARGCLLRWYPGRRRPGRTYQGFIAALQRKSRPLVRAISGHYRKRVRLLAGDRWLVEGWALFGADSTKHDAPMTRANEKALGCASKDGSWPQMVLTTVFHLGSGLPWSFTRGHARSSERRHLMGLLCTLPPDALLLADAGFTGYCLWERIHRARRSFLIRVGGNVSLIRGLGVKMQSGVDGLVWVWPADRQKKRQPPLALRLVTLADGRNRTMSLLTNVLDPALLPDASVRRLYPLRWGVEVLYRSLKQTLQRRKLLSDSPRHARTELSWIVMGVWTLSLIKARRCRLGANCGTASVLRLLRRAMAGESFSLDRTLAELQEDGCHRKAPKKARHWPHKKRPKPPGNPKARNATEEERQLAKELAPLDRAA
jgi:hypothetical protein